MEVKFKCLPHDICRVTSKFGYRVNPITLVKDSFHQGIDFGAKKAGVVGDRLYAVADGKVVYTASMMSTVYGYGHFIIIQHDGFCTLYAHMLHLDLAVGDYVMAGQIVGLMGSTGASTSAHLHFEVEPITWTGYTAYIEKANGIRKYAVNPYPYIEQYRLEIAKGVEETMEMSELQKQIQALSEPIYHNIAEMPPYYQTEIKSLVDKGIIKGNASGDLNMRESMVRGIIIAHRMDTQK